MAAISVTYTAPDAARGAPNKPVTTGLVMDIWNAVEYVKQWLGHSFLAGAVRDHSHDGVDSSLIAVGANYLRNGSFEDGETGWTFTNYSGGSHAVSTSNHRDGAKSIEFTSTVLANGGGDALSNEFQPVSGGEPVPFKFWIWASVANVSSKFEVIWYDNAKSQISATTLLSYASTPTGGVYHGEVAIAPTNARFMRVKIIGGVPAIGTATGTVRFDGITRATAGVPTAEVRTGTPLSIFKVGALNLAQATTAYMNSLGRGADGTEANVEMYVIKPFTMKELHAFASANVPGGQTATFTVRKNGADTALTCQIGGGAASADDLTNVVTFSLGDRFSIKVVSSATAGTNDYTATVRQNKLDKEVGFPVFQWGGALSASGNMGEANKNFTVGGVQGYQVPMPKCLASVWLASFVTTNTNPVLLQRNGAAVPALDAEVAADVALDAQAYYAFDEMDMLAARTTGAWTGAGVIYLQSRDSTKHDPCVLAFSSISQAQATTVYMGGYVLGLASTTEAEVQVRVPAGRYRNLRAELDAIPAAGQTMTITVRKNGVDTALTCQITNAGGRTAFNLTDEIVFAAGDTLSVKSVSSATLGTRSLSISLEPFAP